MLMRSALHPYNVGLFPRYAISTAKIVSPRRQANKMIDVKLLIVKKLSCSRLSWLQTCTQRWPTYSHRSEVGRQLSTSPPYTPFGNFAASRSAASQSESECESESDGASVMKPCSSPDSNNLTTFQSKHLKISVKTIDKPQLSKNERGKWMKLFFPSSRKRSKWAWSQHVCIFHMWENGSNGDNSG